MRYSKTHKEETRSRLLETARAITKKGGFGTTGVDALMSAIGMTGGAFYSHFPSKQALFQAVIEDEIRNSTEMLAGDQNQSGEQLEQCLRTYLSTFHSLHPDEGCVLPALGAEIARAEPEVRQTVEKGLKHIQQAWARRVDDPEAAWAILAQCVGALMLSRVVAKEQTRKEIISSTRHTIEKHYLRQPHGESVDR
ncbi:TetR/AcrR family transcriptional regulator [Pseudomonas sp. B2M1-30]|uniref:TetR/AcrR family transcriptional regulator n=1 Tax=Pseudomonas koreensis TaxID=198620 RepID=A0A9X3B1N8_9PSED|nr:MULTISPECIES: TetR/AcrR family transcriptional regulator [Pseudomonas]MBV4473574.1 TetR/AcrR family transcriptional regulator [Pseudomonas botevensis]MCU0117711.1 TetR/AcrR family transcriptional regulator [Pseudomonas sp. B2M1-30]MCU7247171.1 TetR/AcrR family transcriptional regulator [Pseudomonas koreensis]MCU7259247.1 TetR/AcrR family transcriptional regulator [Pseudomonas koreensis]